MKRIKKAKSKKLTIYIAAVTAIIVVGYLVAANHFSLWPFYTSSHNPEINLDEPTPEQIEAGRGISEQSKKSDPSSEQPENTLSIEITALNQDDEYLTIRTLITALSPGRCELTMTHPDFSPINKATSTEASASVSTCQGFDIPISDLEAGRWTVEVSFANDGITTQTTDEVIIYQ